jgi:hypothetical protein
MVMETGKSIRLDKVARKSLNQQENVQRNLNCSLSRFGAG